MNKLFDDSILVMSGKYNGDLDFSCTFWAWRAKNYLVTRYVTGYNIHDRKHTAQGISLPLLRGPDQGGEAIPCQAPAVYLALLETAFTVEDMNLPGLKLHQLKGDLAGFYAVSVSGNWRVIFRFEAGEASDVDLMDYH
jgi:plasmid maintenance system killer protein